MVNIKNISIVYNNLYINNIKFIHNHLRKKYLVYFKFSRQFQKIQLWINITNNIVKNILLINYYSYNQNTMKMIIKKLLLCFWQKKI